MQIEPRRVFRAGVHTYVVMTVIGGIPSAYGIWVASTKSAAAWESVAMFLLVYAFLLVWAATFRIEITDTELVFRSLIGGTKRMGRSDIKNIRLGIDLSGRGGILRLFVEPKRRNAREMSINAKVFTSEAVRAVLALGTAATVDLGGLEDGVVTKARRKRQAPKR